MEQLAEVSGVRHFRHATALRETVWKQLPAIMKGTVYTLKKAQHHNVTYIFHPCNNTSLVRCAKLTYRLFITHSFYTLCDDMMSIAIIQALLQLGIVLSVAS